MDTNILGKNIARFRREKGLTQEALAAVVGVSGQAVSKWEVGGSPDVDLLPAISDCLGVSTDALFGRVGLTHVNLLEEVQRAVGEAGSLEEQFKLSCEIAWVMHQSCIGGERPIKPLGVGEDFRGNPEDMNSRPWYSEYHEEIGHSRIRIDEGRRYFLLMPTPPEGWKFDDEDALLRVFKLFADADFLKAVIYLYKHHPEMKFTVGFLGKTFGFDDERAAAVVEGLKSLELADEEEMEYDDTRVTYYNFRPNPAIVPFLTFAEDMLRPAGIFWGAMLGPRQWLA
ncbi:MAG: helix-turn-helix domain-containing protein [Oscillospiraceae bacterium]|jgi:transcriptional regulator with XRE-family HTH domain|nr:helix-turn-helix domain-containing protein [Oscillospiraceae bacterium]